MSEVDKILDSLERQASEIMIESTSFEVDRLANVVACLIAVLIKERAQKPDMQTTDKP
jgi:hypothetical protein